MATLKIEIEDEKYTRDELAKLAASKIMQWEDGLYKYQPENPDNFHTDYNFGLCQKKYTTIVAMDIVNPFSKTLNVEKLEELLVRITSEACLDKVGETVYKLTKNMHNYTREDVDNVVTFLNDLNQRKSTSQTVGFKLDLSEF